MYMDGKGVEQSFSEGIRLFEKAATMGLDRAYLELAYLYQNDANPGIYDRAKAFVWWEKLAQRGHAHGQRMLADSYSHGAGVERSDAKAREWYEKAAAQGELDALNSLGIMYHQGAATGLRDYAKAWHYYSEAAKRGKAEGFYNLGLSEFR